MEGGDRLEQDLVGWDLDQFPIKLRNLAVASLEYYNNEKSYS